MPGEGKRLEHRSLHLSQGSLITEEGMSRKQVFSSSGWSSEPSQGGEIGWCHLSAHCSVNRILFLLVLVLEFTPLSSCPIALSHPGTSEGGPLLGPEQTHPPFIPRIQPSFYQPIFQSPISEGPHYLFITSLRGFVPPPSKISTGVFTS